ncbi:hypothetical protein Pfo_000398 [Paulownia fortunei]|nr:hypothetical protein Pfo_000398 [Paulownia fortunei]
MDPFGKLGILVGACRSSGVGRPLTYISKSNSKERSQQPYASPSMQRSLTTSSSAVSKVKKALGLKNKNKEDADPEPAGQSDFVRKRAGTVGHELMRVQMKVSEQTDSRVRRGLLRVAAGQLGRRIEAMVLPLELLQQLRSSDFTTQQEYDAWQKRTLKILEAGLIVHPRLPPDKSQTDPQRLQQILRAAAEDSSETGKHSELMEILRNVATSLACRSVDGSVSDICHWADGIPLNLHLYQILLKAFFDVNEEASLIEEADEMLELIKKTWVILGINQAFHNLCFLWVLFQRYITTGEIEDCLLFAADHMIVEVEKDAKATHDPAYSQILSSVLNLIVDWAENLLLRYHDVFYRGNIEVMKSVLSLGVSAAKILVEDISHKHRQKRKEFDVAYGKVDAYIRSSLHSAFSQAQEKEKVISSRQCSKNQQSPLPLLSILAQNTCELAFNEKEIYSPVLKRWHPLATGVAVATLHACYANELKQFVSGISELNPEAIQVLLAADKHEKDLVEMAEMAPYDAEAVITNMVKSWIWTRVDRLREWVDRSLQPEEWNPEVNGGHFAPSAVEVLRIIDETLEAFFLLAVPMHPVLLPELMAGLNKCLQNYIIKAISGCELDSLENRTMFNLRNNGFVDDENVANGKFGLSVASCMKGIHQLSEATAYKVVFHELSHVLWDYLYKGEISVSRIEPFLQELERYLEVISIAVHDRVRTRVITQVMKASFEGFLLVWLAGGPSRAFTLHDSAIIEEDFKFLTELFWSNGDGLPTDLIDKLSVTVKLVLPLFQSGTKNLVEQFKRATLDSNGTSATSRLPLPPTTGQWSPTEPNTILRVLCHRNDKTASKFLKKTF